MARCLLALMASVACAAPVSVPPESVGIRFRALGSEGGTDTPLTVRLIEKDGDVYEAEARASGQVTVLYTDLAFKRGGDGASAFLSVDRLAVSPSRGGGAIEPQDIRFLVPAPAKPPQAGPPPLADGPAGRAAIFDPIGFPRAGAPADPGRLAGILERAGFAVERLDAAALAGRDLGPFDLLVLPAGPVFPAAARANVLSHLKRGGSLLAIGGYAFDQPGIVLDDGSFAPCFSVVRASEVTGEREIRGINTRFGRPGDTLGLTPDQIGMFDPSDRFERAVLIREIGGKGEIDLDGDFSGWSAVGLIGSNSPVFPRVHARWQPILEAVDRYGRPLGPAGAIVSHFDGPFRGGRWAFFGVETDDLFAEGKLPEAYIARLARSLAARVFAWEFLPSQYCYRGAERGEFSVKIGNFGRSARDGLLWVTSFREEEREVSLNPGEVKVEKVAFTATREFGFRNSLASLLIRPQGEYLAEEPLECGYCVWEPAAGVEGPDLAFEQGLFRVNGRPLFLTGTNQTGAVWCSSHEEPSLWSKDFARLRDHGLNVVRYLHFSPFASAEPAGSGRNRPRDLAAEPPERLVRATDALVYLLARHDQIPFLTLHDWQPVAMTGEELAAQKAWARYWAARYRNVKGFLFDIQNEPVVALEAGEPFRSLWTEFAATLPEAVKGAFEDPSAILAPGGAIPWNDPRGALRERFRIWLFRRWTDANAAGVKEGNPAGLVTVGLLPSNPPIDKALGPKGLSFACFHFYGGLNDLAVEATWADRRAAGQGLTLGEFGAQEAHNARTRGQTGEFIDESVRRYLYTTLVTFGLGGALACSWDMKEMPETVFPWGMAHRDGRPKSVLRAFRAVSLLMRTMRPKPVKPKVVVLLPDANRLGAAKDRIDAAISTTIRTFLGRNVPIALATEEDLLSGGAGREFGDARLWPLPHVASAEACDRVYRELNEGAGAMFGPAGDTLQFTVPTEEGSATIAASPGPPAAATLVHVDAAGALLGVVGGGAIAHRGAPVAELPGPSVLFSPFGGPLLADGVAVLAPLAEGRATIHAAGATHFAVGEVAAGRFVVYESGELERADGGAAALAIDRDRRGSLILIGRPDRFEAAGARLAAGTMLRF